MSPPADKALSAETLELIARRFRVLGEPIRLRLLHALRQSECSVNSLAELAQTTQPNVSKHLRTLQDAGWLRRRQSGNTVYYAIADEVVFELCELMCGNIRQSLTQQVSALPSHRRQKKTARRPVQRS